MIQVSSDSQYSGSRALSLKKEQRRTASDLDTTTSTFSCSLSMSLCCSLPSCLSELLNDPSLLTASSTLLASSSSWAWRSLESTPSFLNSTASLSASGSSTALFCASLSLSLSSRRNE